MKRKFYVGFSAVVFLFGCSSSIVKVIPLEDNIQYYRGTQYVVKRSQNAETSLSFEFADRSGLAFYTYIRNDSPEAITVDPNDFYFSNMVVKLESEEDKNLIGDFSVIDPEKELNRIYEDEESVEDQKTFFSLLNCLFVGAEIVYDISSDEDNSLEDAERRVNVQNGFDDIQSSLEEEQANLEARKSHWAEETLRRTTLHSGEDIGGLIYLPINLVGDQFSVNIVVGNTLHRYSYKKVIKN